jgi:hypothetical protein
MIAAPTRHGKALPASQWFDRCTSARQIDSIEQAGVVEAAIGRGGAACALSARVRN